MTATAFLEEKKTEIRQRLDELKPMVDEFHQLGNALNALNGQLDRPRRGRPAGSGNRAQEAIAALRDAPDGLTVRELGEKLGINQNYLYRVMPTLAQQGKVVKKAGKYQLQDGYGSAL